MDKLTRAYHPTVEETRFSSMEEGVAYAKGGGFEVDGLVASRKDMPGVSFTLLGEDDRWFWDRD